MTAIAVMNVKGQHLKGVKCPKKISATDVYAEVEVKDDDWFGAAVWGAMQGAAGCPNATPSPATTFREGYAAWKARDFQRARHLWDKACEGGNVGACEYLSVLLRAGQGGPQDLVRAREVLDKGCNGGNRAACAQLHDLDKQTKGQPK
jgi:TPR repeat protein